MLNQVIPRSPAPIWQGPKESRAHRAVDSRSRGACRVATVVFGYKIFCESYLERHVLYGGEANPEVIDIQEQLPPVLYPTPDGKLRRHHFDYRFTFLCGTRLAVAVKPSASAEKHQLLEELKSIAPHIPVELADGVLLMTEKDVPKDLVANATFLHHAKRESNAEHDEIVRAIVSAGTIMTIGSVVARSGLEGAAFRTIGRLIGRQEINVLDGGIYDYPTRIQSAAAHVEALAA
jgi:hypothetical protein